MGLLKWYVTKRNSILKNLLQKKINLSSQWANFLERDTYLTSDLKERFLEDYIELFHWLFLIFNHESNSYAC